MRALGKWSFIAVTKNTFTPIGLRQYGIQRTNEDMTSNAGPEYTTGAMMMG